LVGFSFFLCVFLYVFLTVVSLFVIGLLTLYFCASSGSGLAVNCLERLVTEITCDVSVNSTRWWVLSNCMVTTSIRVTSSTSSTVSVSDRRTFPGLRLICSGCVTTFVDITSAIGQPTRPTQPFILPGSMNEMSAVQVAPSGERSQGRGMYGVVCRGNPVWSIPERLEVKFHERCYTSTLYLYLFVVDVVC